MSTFHPDVAQAPRPNGSASTDRLWLDEDTAYCKEKQKLSPTVRVKEMFGCYRDETGIKLFRNLNPRSTPG